MATSQPRTRSRCRRPWQPKWVSLLSVCEKSGILYFLCWSRPSTWCTMLIIAQIIFWSFYHLTFWLVFIFVDFVFWFCSCAKQQLSNGSDSDGTRVVELQGLVEKQVRAIFPPTNNHTLTLHSQSTHPTNFHHWEFLKLWDFPPLIPPYISSVFNCRLHRELVHAACIEFLFTQWSNFARAWFTEFWTDCSAEKNSGADFQSCRARRNSFQGTKRSHQITRH